MVTCAQTLASIVLFLITLASVYAQETSTCDLSAYQQWKNQEYIGPLASDASFWRYQTQRDEIKLTNFLAMELAVAACTKRFDLLYYYLAGKMGPIDIQHSYKTMCRDVCLESDAIHEAAMAASGCSCLELSTQETDPSYHIQGDFCRANTARLLCDRVGYCGVWDCRIDDFMCPRYEWNKKLIPFKGMGTCVRGAATRTNRASVTLTLGLSMLVVFVGAYIL
jgi:hypothetical protein